MNKITIATHSGDFHPDDAFAVAVISLYTKIDPKELNIIRTRDEAVIEKADYVVDVGRVFDSKSKKFDHHQGAGERGNKIPYASFGLVWREYGEEICGDKNIVKMIDEKLVQPIDAQDNGVDIGQDIFINVHDYTIFDAISVLNPTWQEPRELSNELFLKAVRLSRWVLMREIDKARAIVDAEKMIDKIYSETEDKRILVIDKDYPWKAILCKYKEPLYVIRYDEENNHWRIVTVKLDKHTIKSRKDFPEEWAGKTDAELQKVSGVRDAVFCHKASFICISKTKEGALELAKRSIEWEDKK